MGSSVAHEADNYSSFRPLVAESRHLSRLPRIRWAVLPGATAVDERARGQGIASALIGAVSVAARAHGATRVYWHTHASNARARLVYDRLAEDSGFIVYRVQT
jgi:GNAT superfamily N-acetyltransferase